MFFGLSGTKQSVPEKTNYNELYIESKVELINGKVFPIFSLDITENDGSKLLSKPNLLGNYEEEGVDPKVMKSLLYAKINFTKRKINNPCQLNVKLKDKNSFKEIIITAELNIN